MCYIYSKIASVSCLVSLLQMQMSYVMLECVLEEDGRYRWHDNQ